MLIFIFGHGSAIGGKSGSICLVELISYLSFANVCAIHGNPDRYVYIPLERQCNKDLNGNEAEKEVRFYLKVTV